MARRRNKLVLFVRRNLRIPSRRWSRNVANCCYWACLFGDRHGAGRAPDNCRMRQRLTRLSSRITVA